MDDATFWDVIETSALEATGEPDRMLENVRGRLVQLEPIEIKSFQAILNEKLNAAYSWKLWGAAYAINGGCSDDGFEHFRCWLISRGRNVFDAALANPDSLADIVDPEEEDSEHECESLLYVARRAYEKVAGTKMPPPGRGQAREPSGERSDFDDDEETGARLPRLSSRYQ
jgi:hypothetical protein